MQEKEVVQVLLERAETRLRRAQESAAQIPTLETQVKGLKLTLADLNGESPSESPPAPKVDWTTLTRPAAVLRVIEEAGQPIAPSEIANRLKAHGRADKPQAIYNVLDTLRKRDAIRSEGIGKWVRIPPYEPAGMATR